MNRDILHLISAALNEKESVRLSDNTDWNKIFSIAKKHNIISSVYKGMELLPQEKLPDDELFLKLQIQYGYEIRQSALQLQEIERIQSAFENAGIYSIAMKGCNTKLRYPETALRSMGDLDILIKADQNKLVFDAMRELGYTEFEEGRKHDHYRGGSSAGIEMHRELVPANSEFSEYYKDIWTRCSAKDDSTYTYSMSIEDEYIFNIIHLIQHFKLGGIGIRFIMDVYVYNHLCTLDHAYVNEEFEKLGIRKFVDNLVKLSENWFDNKLFSDDEMVLLKKLGKYILNGGLFGSAENASALQTSKGRNKFLLSAVFPDYKSMVSLYPWLEGKAFLLPYAWAHRGIKSLFFRRGNIKTMVGIYKHTDKDKTQKLKRFYSYCGLEI